MRTQEELRGLRTDRSGAGAGQAKVGRWAAAAGGHWLCALDSLHRLGMLRRSARCAVSARGAVSARCAFSARCGRLDTLWPHRRLAVGAMAVPPGGGINARAGPLYNCCNADIRSQRHMVCRGPWLITPCTGAQHLHLCTSEQRSMAWMMGRAGFTRHTEARLIVIYNTGLVYGWAIVGLVVCRRCMTGVWLLVVR